MNIATYDLELHNRLPCLIKESETSYPGCERLNNPDSINEFARDVLGLDRKAEEYVFLISLNTKNVPLGIFPISKGLVGIALASPREIFIRLLLCGATHFIVIHNHPSGDPSPSHADDKLTRVLKETGELIHIQLLDHIIIGAGNAYYSYLRSKSHFIAERKSA